jgi:hypothetical protein
MDNKMNFRPVRLSGLALLVALECVFAQLAAADTTYISREDVRLHFTVLRRMDPKVGDLFRKLVAKYGDKPRYSVEEVQAIVSPKAKTEPRYTYEPKPNRQGSRVPPGGISAADARRHLMVYAERTGNKEDLVAALEQKYGRQPWYLAQEVRDVQENGFAPEKILQPGPPAPLKTGWEPIVDGLAHIKIRQSWSDITAGEDPSLGDNKKVVGDLVGASFSYVHDGKEKPDIDTWSAVGAVIFPMTWTFPDERDLIPERLVIAPSISVNRVSTNRDPKKESDELYYRVGMFGKWVGPSGWLDIIELRGAAVYGTDTGHHAQLPAFETELEPRISWVGINDSLTHYAKIGFKNVLIPKMPELEDQTDDSLLDYQLRLYMHVEGGDLQRAGAKWNVIEGSFFRVGPSLQLRMNAPRLMFGHPVSLTGAYNYVSTIDGVTGNNSFISLDLNISLVDDAELNRKISLHANFTRGGLDLIKKDVRQFTLGLSILF